MTTWTIDDLRTVRRWRATTEVPAEVLGLSGEQANAVRHALAAKVCEAAQHELAEYYRPDLLPDDFTFTENAERPGPTPMTAVLTWSWFPTVRTVRVHGAGKHHGTTLQMPHDRLFEPFRMILTPRRVDVFLPEERPTYQLRTIELKLAGWDTTERVWIYEP